MSATIYLEGRRLEDLHVRCREGFRKLLESCGFRGRMPKLVACGGRGSAFDDFRTAHGRARPGTFIALIIDSEDAVASVEQAWAHLSHRDGWTKPDGARDEQVLLMTTCMETWIVADRAALQRHYGATLHERALPALVDLEQRGRDAIQQSLFLATRNCSNSYSKGKRSFEILAKLDPQALASLLPSFSRMQRILVARL